MAPGLNRPLLPFSPTRPRPSQCCFPPPLLRLKTCHVFSSAAGARAPKAPPGFAASGRRRTSQFPPPPLQAFVIPTLAPQSSYIDRNVSLSFPPCATLCDAGRGAPRNTTGGAPPSPPPPWPSPTPLPHPHHPSPIPPPFTPPPPSTPHQTIKNDEMWRLFQHLRATPSLYYACAWRRLLPLHTVFFFPLLCVKTSLSVSPSGKLLLLTQRFLSG